MRQLLQQLPESMNLPESKVTGNVVGGVPIAAQISVNQFMTNAGQGFIETTFTDGRIKIRGGPTLRINDPDGVYGTAFNTGSPFAMFTADTENPSISSFSGFPMCVPRSATDVLCPLTNRPNIPGTTSKQGVL